MSDNVNTVSIDRRFCGPRGSGNGGYSAGLFAQIIDGPAEVTLKAPAPLDTAIEIRKSNSGDYVAVSGETIIASIKPAGVNIDPPPLPDDEAIEAAHEAYVQDEGMSLVYPYCFVCGKNRNVPDGLRIFAGMAPESSVNGDFWSPHEDLAMEDGLIGSEYLWAALDCPGAFALRMEGAFVLLGRFTVEIMRRPAPGEKLIVAAWRTGKEGRKNFSSSALYDEGRKIIAAANSVWIEPNDPKLLEKLRKENL